MSLVEAYDQRTGRKYLVPEVAVGHPAVGPNLALTPPKPRAAKTPKQPAAKAVEGDQSPEVGATTETPVAGDRKE